MIGKFLKKEGALALALLIFSSFTLTADIIPASSAALRETGLIVAGLSITTAGLYLIVKKSHGYIPKIMHTSTGICSVLAGIITICLSHEIIHEVDALWG